MLTNKEDILAVLKKYFQENADKYHVDLAFLFGSFAMGFVKEESDIDVAVVFSREIEDEGKVSEWTAEISLEIASRVGKEVDVLPINDPSRKPMVYYNAVVLGTPVYVRDKTRYIQVYNQALFQMNDFEIFGSRFQFEAARNVLRRIQHG